MPKSDVVVSRARTLVDASRCHVHSRHSPLTKLPVGGTVSSPGVMLQRNVLCNYPETHIGRHSAC